jgi:predicted flap endonuclease-1-like 5' DNA nuclease
VHAAYRFLRLVVALALLAASASVGWLLLRRQRTAAPTPYLSVVPPLPVSNGSVTELTPPVDEPALPDEAVSVTEWTQSAPDEDDLRQIRGVGPHTEAMLHELGIRSYRQLASLDADGREELRVAVNDTRRRIEREDWVGQAAELHRAKYGRDPSRPA